MSIARKNLEHPVLILIIFSLLGMLGIFTFSKIAVALFPSVESPYLMISTSYPNAGPESVEKVITKRIESAVSGVNRLKKLTSNSSEGSSTVSLEYEYGTNLEVAMNDLRDKLDGVKGSLPTAAKTPSIFRFDSESSPIMDILIQGNRSQDDLKEIAENSIVDVFSQADGVAEVSVSGGRKAQVNVELDQNRMAAYGYTIPTIVNVLSSQNLELGGGKVLEGRKNYIVRTVGEYSSIDEINDTVISTVNGYNIKLSDVGKAYLGFEEITGESFINGRKGVYLSVTKQSGANSVKVSNGVRKKMEQLKETLPSDIEMEIIYDDTDDIKETIQILVDSAWQGLILAVVILFVFLQNIRSTIIIAISIPLSIIITLFTMSCLGITLNMMTLTGLILGVGMIVDASIVIIDNIYAYRERGARPKIASILGSQEMIMSVTSGNLTTICVFIPFLFFIAELGFMGEMFKGVIFTIVIALISSLAVAIFLVPVLAGKFLPLSNRNEKPVTNPFFKFLYKTFQAVIDCFTKIYVKLLKHALENRLITLVVSISILIISIAFIPTMNIVMMINGEESSVSLNITLPIGTPYEETKAICLDFERFAKEEIKGYKSITTSIGGGRSSRTNRGSIQIVLPELKKRIDSASEIQNKLRKHFNDYVGTNFSFREGMRSRMLGSDIDIVLRSNDIEAMLDVADRISDVIEANENCGEASISMDKGLPQVEIVIDRQRAYDFGVNVSTIAREINYAINGTTACVYRDNGKDYNVVVAYKPEDRKKIEDLESIYVKGSAGMISVANFARLEKGLGPISIRRENQTRILHVRAGLINDEINANVVEEQIKEGIKNSFILPDTVSVSYEGAWSETMEQMILYIKIVLMAITLVFGVMAATYESFKAPLINLATMPFLIIGVILLHKITGQSLSIMTMVGVIMLVGIVVNNGIILVDYTNLLVERKIPKMEACLQAGKSRFRPVLMTTLTTVLGMLPMCFATGGQAMIVQPIALAVVGGLLSSTFVTLLVIPVLYSLVMKEKDIKRYFMRINYDELEDKKCLKKKSVFTEQK